MREIRTSGSEGGGAELNRLSLPLSAVPDPQGIGSSPACATVLTASSAKSSNTAARTNPSRATTAIAARIA